MLLLAALFLILGYVLYIPILVTLGWVLLVIGAVLLVLGYAGRPVGGRRYWW